MKAFTAKLEIQANSKQEAAKIKKMLKNILEHMDYEIQVEAAEKVNANPEIIKALEAGIMAM